MMRKIAFLPAAMAVALMALASSAWAAPLTYFDAQIVQTSGGKTTFPANTVMCDPGNNCAEIPFTSSPFDATTNPTGNWSTAASGSDGFWRQRVDPNFGNPEAGTGNGTVYEARGEFDGGNSLNTEDPRVLKTTVNVLPGDVGTTKGVYVLFWTDTGPNWEIAACLECVEDEFMPFYTAGQTDGYVFGVYDVGAGDPSNATPFDLEMNGLTATDAPGGRRLRAAWIGNVVLDQTLTVFVGDGPPAPASVTTGSHNHRAWYDGIAYGDVQNLAPLPCVPEPGSIVLLAIALSGIGCLGRRRAG